MEIASVSGKHVVQPLKDQSWEFAKTRLSANHGLLIEIRTTDGITGLGYAVEGRHIGEPLQGMRQALDQLFAPILIDRDPFDIGPIGRDLNRAILYHTRTKAAVESALFDIVGKALGVPVYNLLGGSYRKSIPVIRLLPIKTPIEMARNAEAVIRDGFRYLKIKVGLDPEVDVARVREIRNAVGSSATLTVDANGGWGIKDAIRALRQMEALGVALAEQPVHADDYDGLARVTNATTIVVEADESAGSLERISHLAQMRAVDAVTLKVGRLGGILAAKKGAAICEAANLRCRVGFTGASRLNAAVDMHVIASTPNVDFACEVGEFTRMESDPIEGLEVVDGDLRVPDGPGLGVSVRSEAA